VLLGVSKALLAQLDSFFFGVRQLRPNRAAPVTIFRRVLRFNINFVLEARDGSRFSSAN
jgi:hypothetical protein